MSKPFEPITDRFGIAPNLKGIAYIDANHNSCTGAREGVSRGAQTQGMPQTTTLLPGRLWDLHRVT